MTDLMSEQESDPARLVVPLAKYDHRPSLNVETCSLKSGRRQDIDWNDRYPSSPQVIQNVTQLHSELAAGYLIAPNSPSAGARGNAHIGQSVSGASDRRRGDLYRTVDGGAQAIRFNIPDPAELRSGVRRRFQCRSRIGDGRMRNT